MIKIIADISSDIPKKVANERGIAVMPFYITMDNDESVLAGIDYEPEMFYEKLKTLKEIPKTGQTPPPVIEEFYRAAGKENQIIHITISGAATGTVNNAYRIAKQLNEEEGFDITVVDSRTFSMANGYHILCADDMAKEGKSKEEIVEYLEKAYARDTVYFTVDDLTFLKKGGRIKATTAGIAAALDIKPICHSADGLVEVFAKVRGMKKAISKMVEVAEKNMKDPKGGDFVILASECPEKVEYMKKLVSERLGTDKVSVYPIGPVITCHAGTNVLGMFFEQKDSE